MEEGMKTGNMPVCEYNSTVMLRCSSGGVVIVASALGVEVVVVVMLVRAWEWGGYRRSVRLPVLAHPGLAISCLPAEKYPAPLPPPPPAFS